MEHCQFDNGPRDGPSGGQERERIPAETLIQKLPTLAIAGDEHSIDRIAYELLFLLMESVDADIGQLGFLPRGGRVEKFCIIKDGRPWLREDAEMHLYNPSKGFTGSAVRTGRTILVEDIWEADGSGTNPFLEIYPSMDPFYIEEIKKPVASTVILPVKRNNETFCTIELSRYRAKPSFGTGDKAILDDFAVHHGALIVNYILDAKNRIVLNAVYEKLNSLSRLIASKAKVDYTDAIAPYRTLSAADMGFAFFRRGSGFENHALYIVAWRGDETKEVYFPEFEPSADSVLCDNAAVSFPVEGRASSRRLQRFRKRIQKNEDIRKSEKKFLLDLVDTIRSYVVYPFHMLDQDLGAIHLASSRNDFLEFLHMSPFLSLYNALLKSFLLNERVADILSQISLKIHNPGFYCLAGLKGELLQQNPDLLHNPRISAALRQMDDLFNEMHGKGRMLKCRFRNVHLRKWLSAWVNQKRSLQPGIEFEFITDADLPQNSHVRANYTHLETVFENLLSNSLRAIAERHARDAMAVGKITIALSEKQDHLLVLFQDNGVPYKTVSGRGSPAIQQIMEELGGKIEKHEEPYRVLLIFPYNIIDYTEVDDEN